MRLAANKIISNTLVELTKSFLEIPVGSVRKSKLHGIEQHQNIRTTDIEECIFSNEQFLLNKSWDF